MLNHKGTKTIETDRLILRQFTIEDAPAMFRNWASDDEVTKHLPWPTHTNEEITRTVLSDWTGHYGDADFYNWAIVLKENGPEPIGNISVVRINPKTDCATIGYCMSCAHWRKGIMPEALKALVDFLFDEVGFNRIEAKHAVENPASGRVMRKCGMTYEGRSRQSHRSNSGLRDMENYAILAHDTRRNVS